MKRTYVALGVVGFATLNWLGACGSDSAQEELTMAGAAGELMAGGGDPSTAGTSASEPVGGVGAAAGQSTNASAGGALGGQDGGDAAGAGAGGRDDTLEMGGSGGEAAQSSSGEGGGCSETIDVCVTDPNWTCETFHDCPYGICDEVDHLCHDRGFYGDACDTERPCMVGYRCVGGFCDFPPDDDVWDCLTPDINCQPGQFCREYAISSNGSYCAALEDDFSTFPCHSDFNCGPRFECSDQWCQLREEATIPCLANPSVCGEHYYCEPTSGICQGRKWASCATNPDICPVYTFCNAAKQCAQLPGLGEPCRDGKCRAMLKCEAQPDPSACGGAGQL